VAVKDNPPLKLPSKAPGDTVQLVDAVMAALVPALKLTLPCIEELNVTGGTPYWVQVSETLAVAPKVPPEAEKPHGEVHV
jgi:hypothetical protein